MVALKNIHHKKVNHDCTVFWIECFLGAKEMKSCLATERKTLPQQIWLLKYGSNQTLADPKNTPAASGGSDSNWCCAMETCCALPGFDNHSCLTLFAVCFVLPAARRRRGPAVAFSLVSRKNAAVWRGRTSCVTQAGSGRADPGTCRRTGQGRGPLSDGVPVCWFEAAALPWWSPPGTVLAVQPDLLFNSCGHVVLISVQIRWWFWVVRGVHWRQCRSILQQISADKRSGQLERLGLLKSHLPAASVESIDRSLTNQLPCGRVEYRKRLLPAALWYHRRRRSVECRNWLWA